MRNNVPGIAAILPQLIQFRNALRSFFQAISSPGKPEFFIDRRFAGLLTSAPE
jgi:hypothetical protein